jgi:hypothetical protein
VNNEQLRAGFFKLRADLLATNLAVDAITSAMPPEQHKQLMAAWSALREEHTKTLEQSSATQESHEATLGALKRMQTRLARARELAARLKGQD